MCNLNCALFLSMGLVLLGNISCSNKYIIPNPNEILIERGAFKDTSLRAQLRVLVWNIAKGEKDGFASDFRTISSGADVVLIQEYLQSEKTKQVFSTLDSMLFKIAISFRYKKKDSVATGVATGSTAKPIKAIPLVSEDREPLIHTPKTTLVYRFNKIFTLVFGKSKFFPPMNDWCCINFFKAFENSLPQFVLGIDTNVFQKGPCHFAKQSFD
jgi:hypothetical protein